MKFFTLKNTSIIVVSLFLSAFAVSDLTYGFRYSEYRWIYQAGWVTCYFLHFISFMLSLINSFGILMNTEWNRRKKLPWLMLSLIPVAFWIVVVFVVIIKVF